MEKEEAAVGLCTDCLAVHSRLEERIVVERCCGCLLLFAWHGW